MERVVIKRSKMYTSGFFVQASQFALRNRMSVRRPIGSATYALYTLFYSDVELRCVRYVVHQFGGRGLRRRRFPSTTALSSTFIANDRPLY